MLAHRHSKILLSLILALVALSLLLLGIAGAAGITGHEAALDPNGAASQVNRDDRGDLWISDYGADEIWHVSPPTGAYTVYQGMSHATDARMGAAEMVWWTDASDKLGHIALGTRKVTMWTLPGVGQLWGLAFDDNGLVWTTDVVNNQVYSFAPGSSQLCAYPLPDDGASDYIVAGGAAIWLGDNLNARIVRLDSASNEFTSWQLPASAFPEGLALDGNGDLWWADLSRSELGRLEPASNRVTAFALPAGSSPEMIALDRGKVWYTESISGTMGMLDPAVATGTSSVMAPKTAAATPDCQDLGAGITSDVVSNSGLLAWSTNTYTQTVSGGGWAVYQLPEDAIPSGVAASAGQVWVVDQGRQQLLRLPLTSPPLSRHVYLPYVRRQ